MFFLLFNFIYLGKKEQREFSNYHCLTQNIKITSVSGQITFIYVSTL